MNKVALLDALSNQMLKIEDAMIDKPKDKQLDRDLAFLAHVYDVINEMTWIEDEDLV